MSEPCPAARLHIENDDGDVVAVGVQFPDSGTIVVEWRREAFPPGERTDEPTRSHYSGVDDAAQCAGEVVFGDYSDMTIEE